MACASGAANSRTRRFTWACMRRRRTPIPGSSRPGARPPPGSATSYSLEHVKRLAKQAKNVPSAEASFRNLVLNQRVATSNLFIPPSIWKACGGPVNVEALARGVECYAGLDLSAVSDLTALVVIGKIERKWHVVPTFWLPAGGRVEKGGAYGGRCGLWARERF